MDIWTACQEDLSIVAIKGELIRIVESQEQVATNSLVDNLAEQALLDDMLEQSKPPFRPGTESLHYLLATPFRYPPLAHGSRFGSRFEPSLFYGAQNLTTALAETAYYRFVFWSGMRVPPPSSKFLTQHTVFAANYGTDTGLQLQEPPFAAYEKQITAPNDYPVTQALGSSMREHGVAGFEYVSARDRDKGINVALFTPDALNSNEPLHQQSWLCETQAESVNFTQANEPHVFQFTIESYTVNGQLPQPAV